jgi:hypothetical protein
VHALSSKEAQRKYYFGCCCVFQQWTMMTGCWLKSPSSISIHLFNCLWLAFSVAGKNRRRHWVGMVRFLQPRSNSAPLRLPRTSSSWSENFLPFGFRRIDDLRHERASSGYSTVAADAQEATTLELEHQPPHWRETILTVDFGAMILDAPFGLFLGKSL